MPHLVLGHGTWGRAQAWHLPGSAFRAEAEAHGYTVHDFLWSGVLAGVPTKLPGDPLEAVNGADSGMLLPWLDAGEKLVLWLKGEGLFDDPDLYLWSHSHFLQVGTFAVIRGARFKRWLSVSGPVVERMARARRIARDGIGKWMQFADPTGTDTTIIEGELELGTLPHLVYALPEGLTIETPYSGHSGLVNDVALRARFRAWETLAG